MSGVAAPARRAERARATAERVAVVRLLNIYLRETGGAPPGTRGDGPAPPEVEAMASRVAGADLAWVTLPRTGVVLVAPLVARSAIGHHRFGGPVWRIGRAGRAGPGVPTAGRDLPTPGRDVPTPAPEAPTAGREVPTPGREVPTAGRDLPTPGRDVPTPGRDLPTPAPEVPTAGRDLPTPGRDVPTPGREVPTAGRDVPTAGREVPTAGPAGTATAAGTAAAVESPAELAELLAAELLAGTEPDEPGNAVGTGSDVVSALRREVASSVDRSARYVAHHLGESDRPHPVDDPDPTRAAERALVFGHPFHPAPKLADGFSVEDTADYAPELSAGFPLWWIAAPPELVEDEHLPSAGPLPVPLDVAEEARRRLDRSAAGWALLPCHPWQARALAARDDLAAALDDGSVRLIGPIGPDVQPTSSVRTVRQVDGSFWKLSLDVRITNFVRHNTPEQVRRTLDAGRIVAALPPRLRSGRFEILTETAYRALALPGAAALSTATAALHRPGPAPGPAPMVVAGLVEPDPRDGSPPLARLLAVAARTAEVPVGRIGRRWLRAYLRVSLRPLLRLLLDQGISLEAHTQNSLAGFTDGWPRRLVVRDLEGTSVDRSHPLAGAHRRLLGTECSPVFYTPEDAWQRFAYYVVVNHLGQVVATVAAVTGVPEDELWAEVAALVRAEAAAASGPPAHHLRRALLGPHLPAKANLLSRLLSCSERPVYVDVPNPAAGT